MLHLHTSGSSIVAFFWVGFFMLEGFDFGVGMLHSFVGTDRRGAAHRGQHDRAGLGRQRGVAGRGRCGDVRAFPGGTRRCSRRSTSRWCWCWWR